MSRTVPTVWFYVSNGPAEGSVAPGDVILTARGESFEVEHCTVRRNGPRRAWKFRCHEVPKRERATAAARAVYTLPWGYEEKMP